MVLGRRLTTCAALLSVALLVGCATTGSSSGTGSGAPGSGEALVNQKCKMCHTLDRVNGAVYDEAKWTSTVERMQQNGLVVTEEEKQAIIAYLAERDASR